MEGSGMISSSIYSRIASKALGEELASAFGNRDVPDADFSRIGKLGGKPGGKYTDPTHGVRLRIMRVRGAAVAGIGTTLKRYIGGAGRTGTFSAATKAVVTTTSTFADNDIGGAFLQTTGGTGPNQFKNVLEFDSAANATITVSKRDAQYDLAAIASVDAYAVTPDATTTFSLYAPWEVTPCTAVGDFVSAVAISTVTQNNWTLVVDMGPVPILTIGTTDAAVAGDGAYPSSTLGTCKGPTAAGVTAAEAVHMFGIFIDAYSGAAARRLVDLLGRFAQ
jgi:hypothetical protein